MSTIGTHLNWGSSYVVNDFYRRFVKPDAPEKELVAVGRITTVSLMVIAGLLSLFFLNNATQAFDVLLLSGAGTGAIYLLRWFWWRINAWTEIAAMIAATVSAIVLVFFIPDDVVQFWVLDVFTSKLLIAVVITTIVWILTTYLTNPESKETLRTFYRRTRPGGPGWKKVVDDATRDGVMIIDEKDIGRKWEMPLQILSVFIGIVAIYSSLFSIGSFIYGKPALGILLALIAVAGTIFLFKTFDKLNADR